MFKKLLQLKTLLVALLVMAGAGNVWADEVTDVLTASDLTATEATYKSFSNVSITSDAVYAGQSAKDASGNIQLRSKNSNSGIVSTTSGGKVKSVKITIGSGSNTIDVYGYNTAFTSASDLYKTGPTKVGSLTQTGTISFNDDYEYVGIRSNNGAVYISSIEIVWEVAGGSSYPLTSISLSGTYQTTFTKGAAFSHEGMTVTATYSDASTKDVTASATFTGYDMATLGQQTVTVSYKEGEVTKTAIYGITVNEAPSHNVTWSVNGETTTESYKEGASISFPANPADVNGKIFVGWVTDAIAGTTDTAPDFVTSATMGTSDVTYYAVFADLSTENSGWYETAISNITSSDVFVFSNGSYAIPNDGGTSYAPAATSITVEDGKVKSDVTDALKWNVSGNATDGYTFYPNGSTTTWLYCNTTASSKSNENIRVGTGDRKFWVFNISGYLVTNDSYTDRYLSLYSSQDFRGYTGTGNGAFVPKFYKYVGASYSAYCTSVIETPKTATTLTIDATGITNTDVYVSKSAGALAATVLDESDEPVEDVTVTWTSGNTDVATIAADGTVTLVAAGTTTLTATYAGDDTYAGSTNKYELTVTDSEPTPIFAKVTDVSALTPGDVITFVNEEAGVALGKIKTNNYGDVSVTIDNNVFESKNVEMLTLVEGYRGDYVPEGESVWAFKNSNDKYLNAPGTITDDNHMKESSELNTESSAVIRFDADGNATVRFTNYSFDNTSARVIVKYNSSGKLFSCYKSGQNPIQIYKVVTNSPLSVSAAGYATFSSTSALDFTNVEDINAYTATVSGNDISFKRVKKVRANTGLLLRSVNVDGGAVSTSVPSLTDAAEDVTGNAFVAATTEIASLNTKDGDFTNYILNNGSSGIGFYQANGKKVGAGKAYLRVSSKQATTRAFIAFSFDDPETGVAQVETLPQQGVAYDLQGRRVNAPKGGLYIINGKKVIVK